MVTQCCVQGRAIITFDDSSNDNSLLCPSRENSHQKQTIKSSAYRCLHVRGVKSRSVMRFNVRSVDRDTQLAASNSINYPKTNIILLLPHICSCSDVFLWYRRSIKPSGAGSRLSRYFTCSKSGNTNTPLQVTVLQS